MTLTPDETRALAEQASEAIRQLNHATLPWDAQTAFEGPADAYAVIATLAEMASRLPQLMDQLSAYLVEQLELGRVAIDGGQHVGDPLAAVGGAGFELEGRCRYAANMLAESLCAAQNSIAFARVVDPASLEGALHASAIEAPLPFD